MEKIEPAYFIPAPREPFFQAALGFLTAAVSHPFSIGAVAPTTPHTARLIARASRASSASAVLELGAGAGAVTREILRILPPSARLFALERNAGLAASLRRHAPSARVICGCASRLRAHALEHRIARVDSIVSTLPWTHLPYASQREVLEASAELLAPGGTFLTVRCAGLHATRSGRRFHALLRETFPGLEASSVAWQNFPPLLLLRGRKTPHSAS
jgi:phospholipid N-methyltransferase